ncbi:alpha/beta fold hydrolase [Allosalinactinospora lopnorensis]|uniref:alpha/beta fold hydrolase n=1 Tax=Allosalinactinospora lopnorensis TaxID=1352348 RepID=UPI000623DADE|nr:alpha/beta hydrolase [Allosalinactinospora lopnorensis]
MWYEDWGARSARWAGISSETVDVHGTRVHVLRAGAAPEAPAGAPTQLLVHGMGGAAWHWLDVLRPLTAHGPVIAPDLPGHGRTRPPRRHATGVRVNARFLRAFTSTLGLDRVVLHGHSAGGLVSLLFTALAPERVERLVLVDPALPAPLSSRASFCWQTVGRAALFLVLSVGRPWFRLFSKVPNYFLEQARGQSAKRLRMTLGVPGNISPELTELITEDRELILTQPWRLDATLATWTTSTEEMYVARRALETTIARVAVPTLLLWGARDRIMRRPVIDRVTVLRPDWELHVFETAGHLPQWEAPEDYVAVVREWMRRPEAPAR